MMSSPCSLEGRSLTQRHWLPPRRTLGQNHLSGRHRPMTQAWPPREPLQGKGASSRPSPTAQDGKAALDSVDSFSGAESVCSRILCTRTCQSGQRSVGGTSVVSTTTLRSPHGYHRTRAMGILDVSPRLRREPSSPSRASSQYDPLTAQVSAWSLLSASVLSGASCGREGPGGNTEAKGRAVGELGVFCMAGPERPGDELGGG